MKIKGVRLCSYYPPPFNSVGGSGFWSDRRKRGATTGISKQRGNEGRQRGFRFIDERG